MEFVSFTCEKTTSRWRTCSSLLLKVRGAKARSPRPNYCRGGLRPPPAGHRPALQCPNLDHATYSRSDTQGTDPDHSRLAHTRAGAGASSDSACIEWISDLADSQ